MEKAIEALKKAMFSQIGEYVALQLVEWIKEHPKDVSDEEMKQAKLAETIRMIFGAKQEDLNAEISQYATAIAILELCNEEKKK